MPKKGDWSSNEPEAEDYQRTDDLREDPVISTGSATLNDYRGSGYDRGHLAPAEDFEWSAKGMGDTFFMSNMSPQNPSLNRGIWKKLVNRVRKWAVGNEEIYVVAGPVLTDGPYKAIGENSVSIPKRFYKVILAYKDPGLKAIGFIMPNERSTAALGLFAASVDVVERLP